MKYISTRGDQTERKFCEILLEGLAPDGGLYLPTHYPKIDDATLTRWRGLYGNGQPGGYADLAFQPDATAATPILPISDVITAFYLRLQVADQTGVLSRITTILAEHDISIDAVLQRESAEGEKQTDLIILTHDTAEGRMRAALAQMQALPTVLAPIVNIRKEELS